MTDQPDETQEPNAPQQVKPLDLDAVRTVQVGTVLWAIALLALLPFHGQLHDDGHTWWLWTCLVGVLLGLAGIAFTTNRRRRIQARARASA